MKQQYYTFHSLNPLTPSDCAFLRLICWPVLTALIVLLIGFTIHQLAALEAALAASAGV